MSWVRAIFLMASMALVAGACGGAPSAESQALARIRAADEAAIANGGDGEEVDATTDTLTEAAPAVSFEMPEMGEPWIETVKLSPGSGDPAADCRDGDALSCFLIGSLLEKKQQAYEQAIRFYETACADGVPVACYNVGILYQRGEHVAHDYARSWRYLALGCEGGWAAACGSLGMAIERGYGRKVDIEQAAAVYQGACEAGDRVSCNNLAWLLRTQEPPDHARALSLYERACADGHLRACMRHAGMVAEGCTEVGQACDPITKEQVENDPERRKLLVERLKRACDADGKAAVCTALGFIYEHGDLAAQDLARAFELYEQGCKSGHAWSCNNLASFYRRGQHVEKDGKRAVALYEKACAGGFAIACQDLGAMYFNGDGVAKDLEAGVVHIRHACKNGRELACLDLMGVCKLALPDACTL